MANYPSVSENVVRSTINLFNFERVHARLTKEKCAYYSCVDNHKKRVPSIVEMIEIAHALRESIQKNGISQATSNCFKMTKNKKGDVIRLMFDYELVKKFI